MSNRATKKSYQIRATRCMAQYKIVQYAWQCRTTVLVEATYFTYQILLDVSCLMVENIDPCALRKLQQTWHKGVTVIPISLFQSPVGWVEPWRTSTRLRDPQTNALSSARRRLSHHEKAWCEATRTQTRFCAGRVRSWLQKCTRTRTRRVQNPRVTQNLNPNCHPYRNIV
jgi:hypothetical protein